MYTCGQTVYDYAHIGHAKKYIGDDLLRRTLEYLGYKVKHVQNVTDVGHLISDADEGEDKIEKGSRKYNKSPKELTDFFTNYHFTTMDKFNILRPHIVCRATEHISLQISLIETLIKKGYAYETPEAIYYDISKFANYENLFHRGSLENKMVAVREEIEHGEFKKNPQDFVLWFKAVGRFAKHIQQWDSPWGRGFPGWHIECSAMSMHYLGESFDIHTGGEDHIATHHANEIAQSEAATGKQLAKYWVHHIFLKVDGEKMGKSKGNMFRVEDFEAKGYSPLTLRYLCLQTHYRKPLNFTWDSLAAAQTALKRLYDFVGSKPMSSKPLVPSVEKESFRANFESALSDDLNLPKALSIVWELITRGNKGEISKEQAIDILLDFDSVLGLDLSKKLKKENDSEISEAVKELVKQRALAKEVKDYQKADELRSKLEKLGYKIVDTAEGSKLVDR